MENPCGIFRTLIFLHGGDGDLDNLQLRRERRDGQAQAERQGQRQG